MSSRAGDSSNGRLSDVESGLSGWIGYADCHQQVIRVAI